METNNADTALLHDILEKNIDAHKGYSKAAELAQNNDLKQFFRKKSGERKSFMESLKTEMENHYGPSGEDGSLTGSIHRTWMDVKSFFSGNADEAMLEEALRAERKTFEEYEKTLNENNFPMAIGAILRDQKMKIQVDLNKIKSLDDLD